MKKIPVLLAMWVAVVSTTFAQLYTPRGSYVSVIGPNTETQSSAQIAATNASAQQQYPNATLISSATGRYNCHSYAWNSTATSNNYWLNSPSDDAYWLDGSYTYTTSANAQKWSYSVGDHSANTYSGGTFQSKWGAWPVMRHAWNYSPYNSSSMWAFEYCPTSSSSCKAPSNFWVNSTTSSSIVLAFSRACNAAQYQVQYQPTGSTTWYGMTVYNAPTGQYLATSRTINCPANSCYKFRIKVINGSAVTYSSEISACSAAARMANPAPNGLDLGKTVTMPDETIDETNLVAVDDAMENKTTALSISPNPSQGALLLNLTSAKTQSTTIEVADATGKTVYSKTADLTEGNNTMNLQLSLPAGIYLVRAQIDGKQMVQKLIIE